MVCHVSLFIYPKKRNTNWSTTVGCVSAHWCIQSWFHLEPDSFSSLCRKLRENGAGLWSILKTVFWFSIKTVQPWACPKLCVRSTSRHSDLYTTTRTVQWLKENLTASSQQGSQLTPAENTGRGNKTDLEDFSFMKEYVLELSWTHFSQQPKSL